MPNLDNSTV